MIITNSGSQRFDVYGGTFTKNDQLTASPFDDSFLYIANISASIANAVLPALNNAGANERRGLEARESEMWGRGWVEGRYGAWLQEMDARANGIEKRAAGNLTLGYVTNDVRPFSYFPATSSATNWAFFGACSPAQVSVMTFCTRHYRTILPRTSSVPRRLM